MPTDIESQLHELGEWFRSEMTHVRPDEFLDPPQRTAPVEGGTLIGLADRRSTSSRRARWLTAVAAASALVLMGGLLLVAQRDDTGGSLTEPAPTQSTPPPLAEPGPPGALVLPDGLGMSVTTVTFAEDGSLVGDVPIRWYATSQPRSETGPYLRVLSIEQEVSDGPRFDCEGFGRATREQLLDDDTTACLELRDDSDPLGRIFVARTPTLVVIEGQVTDDELVTAANKVAPASYGPGFEVVDAGLPDDVSLTGIGWNVSDFAASSLDDAYGPMINARWTDDDERSMFYLATRGSIMSNLRLGYQTITDITVRGEPGFVRTLANDPNFVGVVWRENDMTYQVGSQRLGEDRLLDLIEQLHLATHDDWEAATSEAEAATNATSATPGPPIPTTEP